MLRLEIKKLGQKLDGAIGRRQAADPPAPFWLGLPREEHLAQLAELRAWVDRGDAGLGHRGRVLPDGPASRVMRQKTVPAARSYHAG
jgi:hypothetical protein